MPTIPVSTLLLGDDFSVDQINEANPSPVSQAQVRQRYTIQLPYLGIIGYGAPVFLVNGNHEQGARYLLNGTPNSVAVWAQNSRNALLTARARRVLLGESRGRAQYRLAAQLLRVDVGRCAVPVARSHARAK
ncbi:hypothetical protein [Gemmatimonas sp.]|uniref:hypothetical protein n=1 Tax=Gemmatimonas sp. TaxID=1962908 RepID=UPI003563F17A